jgi:hypothetical protein
MTPDDPQEQTLREQIEALQWPIHMTSKAQIVEYYRDMRGRRWKQDIVHDLAPIANKKSKNLEKRFDPQRLEHVEKRNAGQYRELGRQLPPIGLGHPKAYRVEFSGMIRISEGCYPRGKTVIVPAPPDGMITIHDVLRAYWKGKKPAGERFCDERDGEAPPSLTVRAT